MSNSGLWDAYFAGKAALPIAPKTVAYDGYVWDKKCPMPRIARQREGGSPFETGFIPGLPIRETNFLRRQLYYE
jgi:hypothetical protein